MGEPVESRPPDDERGGSRSRSTGGRLERDFWDYLEILLRPSAAVSAALVVALIGWGGQRVLEREQDARLYTELMSKREESEAQLRSEMFTKIMDSFLEVSRSSGEDNRETSIAERLLKLELLALNFGESLSLSPLFVELDGEIELLNTPPGWWRIRRDQLRARLQSLAKRVASWQLSALSQNAVKHTFDVPLEDVIDDQEYEEGERFTLDGVTRRYHLRLRDADPLRKTLRVGLNIEPEGEVEANHEIGIQKEFTLELFNFPMIDNTRLANDQRFAVIMEDFDRTTIRVSIICFKGMYGSQRDKPILDHIRREMKSKVQG